jgi:hypothetical protein
MAGRLSFADLPAKEKEARWNDLMGRDTPAAYRAFYTLTAAPAEAVPFLRERVQPVTDVDSERLARLLADLDSDQFAVREKATAELEKVGEPAESVLRKALTRGSTSPEARRRIEAILGKMQEDGPSPERRTLWAIEVLEKVSTPEARQVLEELAGGTDRFRVTRAAKAALERFPKP